jgi:hypothetical protein
VTYFPVQNEPRSSYPDGLIEGTLVLENGALRLTNKYAANDNTALLVWPHGFSCRVKGDEIHIFDDKGRFVAAIGDQLRVGGGEGASAGFIDSLASPPLLADCPGPYWLVSPSIINDTLELEKGREKLDLPGS